MLGKSLLDICSVQFSRSVVSDSLWPHESQHTRPPCPSPTPGVHSDTSIESVMPSSYLILGRPLLLLPPIPPTIKVISNESVLHIRWSEYWSFSISPYNEYSGLDDRGWDGWMASRTRWMWVWVNSGSWWWTGRPGVLRFMGSQRVGHDWATEVNWTELISFRVDSLGLLAVQGTLKSLLQHHSSKA